MGGLQGLREDHHIELAARKQGKALVDVGLDHIHAAPQALTDMIMVDLGPIPMAAFLGLQPVEQGTIATAKVEHAGSLGHPLGNLGEVSTQRRQAHAMPSK